MNVMNSINEFDLQIDNFPSLTLIFSVSTICPNAPKNCDSSTVTATNIYHPVLTWH